MCESGGRGAVEEVLAEYLAVFQVCPFSVLVFIGWSVPGQEVIAAGPCITHLVLLLIWAWS